MFSVIAIVITLALIIFLAYKKLNIVVVSIIAAVLLAIMDGQDLLEALTTTFMTGASGYVQKFFLLFFISTLFGKVMEKTGAAASIAKWLAGLLGEKYAILGVVFAGMILCYGGISTLVIAFTMYPIALALFQRANLPRRLIPGAIAAGCFTFAATAFHGTPQTNNVVPIPYLGTTVNAAPVLGTICGVIGVVLISLYMFWEGKRARVKGEGFEADASILATLQECDRMGEGVNPFIALIPIIVIIGLLVIVKANVLLSLLIGTIVCALLLFRNIKDLHVGGVYELLEAAVKGSMTAVVTTGCIVGYGSVVSASKGFALLTEALTQMNVSPLLSFALATTILSGAAGSGTGGMGITLTSMASQYLDMGLNPEVLHRVATLSSIGLDSLPHNGAVVVLLTLCGMTHKDSYKQIFVSTVVITLIVAAIAVVLGTIMYPIA